MSAVTPRTQTQGLPANGVTAGAVQITGTAIRISARITSGNGPSTLALIRMNTGTGNWYRVTDQYGQSREWTLPGTGDSNQGNADLDVTLPAEGAAEYYQLLVESPSAFPGTAEIESLSAPAAAGGTVPQGRAINTGGGVTGGGDLSADRTLSLGGTADQTLSTGALTWAGAANKAGSALAGTGAALTLGSNGAAVASFDTGGAGLVLAANKNLSGAAGTGAVDLSPLTGTFKPPTGLFTFQGKQAATAAGNNIADPGNAGAIPVTASGVCNITSAGAETRTLAIPTFQGQRLNLCMNVDGGDVVITVASAFNQAANTTITMNDAGDSAELVGTLIGSALRWRLVYNDGCTLG